MPISRAKMSSHRPPRSGAERIRPYASGDREVGSMNPLRNIILEGDALTLLKSLPDACVQTRVTSPPFWGLRLCDTALQVWGGSSSCQHEWESPLRTPWANAVPGLQGRRKNTIASHWGPKESGAYCQRCGAWRGELGQELTIGLYIAHLVTVLRQVRRVLRSDGTLWLQLADCYGLRAQGRQQTSGSSDLAVGRAERPSPQRRIGGAVKNKDLVGVLLRCTLALQRDGWYLRSDIIGAKTAPESALDRPPQSHDHLFLLAKSERYY